MRWIIAVDPKRNAQALAWCQAFAKGYDLSHVEWIRFDTGRHLPGRRQPQGVYGRCYYPSRDRRTFRVSCQVPGPFPHRPISKRQPLYEGRDPAWLSIPRGWESNGIGEAVRWNRDSLEQRLRVHPARHASRGNHLELRARDVPLPPPLAPDSGAERRVAGGYFRGRSPGGIPREVVPLGNMVLASED